MGMKDRQYDPIRITVDETVNRANEGIMQMDDNRGIYCWRYPKRK